MSKKALSVTLDTANVVWLKGRARLTGGNVSDALDKVITHARTGSGVPLAAANSSVVGLVDLSDDPLLTKADAAVRDGFNDYLTKSFEVHEDPPQPAPRNRAKKPRA
jgi:hypothetical protein